MTEPTESDDNDDTLTALRSEVERLRAAEEDSIKFLDFAVHELRTPLAAVLGFLEILIRRREQLTEDALVELLDRSLASARDLARRIDVHLDASMFNPDREVVEPRPMLLAAELRSEVAALALVVHGHNVVIDIPDDLVVLADRDATDRVMLNLLTNAAKVSDSGSSIEIKAERRGDLVRVSVSDHGPGIEKQDQASVYDPASDGVVSTRVGLAVVRRLIELQGGSVGMESKPGGGSTLWFELPAGSS